MPAVRANPAARRFDARDVSMSGAIGRHSRPYEGGYGSSRATSIRTSGLASGESVPGGRTIVGSAYRQPNFRLSSRTGRR